MRIPLDLYRARNATSRALHTHKQWLRVYMRSKMIKHNKEPFERIDEPVALVQQLHIY